MDEYDENISNLNQYYCIEDKLSVGEKEKFDENIAMASEIDMNRLFETNTLKELLEYEEGISKGNRMKNI